MQKYSLDKVWEYRIERGLGYVCSRVTKQAVCALSGTESVALKLMNGTRTHSENREIMNRIVEKGDKILDFLVFRLKPLLSLKSQLREIPYNLETLARVKPPNLSEGLRTFPGPKILHWWSTSYCYRRCVYCFAQPIRGRKARDSLIENSCLKKIFNEASTLGCEYLLIGGAEPLLRRDLPKIMGDSIKSGINPLLTTKGPISEELALQFAEAGVRHISLSIDSVDRKINKTLIGSGRYATQVKKSVVNLQKAGVAFSIQTVLTSFTLSGMDKVAAFAAKFGAKVLQFVSFVPVVSPMGKYTNEDMEIKREAEVERKLEQLSNKFSYLRIEKFRGLDKDLNKGYTCDIGKTKLFFLPNGIVHRCYKLIHMDHLRGEDLRKVSLARAWHDPKFANIISPPHNNYKGSECHACGKFLLCHEKGRCLYKAWDRYGRLEAKDRDCKKSEIENCETIT
ncbi:MAG: radical SAM protein [Candidatus Scalindua sp. AMX11]|nr:MAG: radical SAM protein [Candidatus Scalindua sp.]NOG83333.1 radical SAM protein [Planctomycetota bacterium]RZV76767.1 MAG: radical SAM protein [Candidatus Scalindua sp. SCAELEC01]TDE63951.1 MAG: radical SAM protein [Candidatus Scalindua sp. AMX11]GJQ60249.1 MAG: hypothetical protein SCALA701_30500 [Candidatus Scalindua sp.]